MNSLVKSFSYILAFFILVIALLVSTTSLFSPLINDRKNQIAGWASDYIGMPVTIQNIKITWSHYQPSLTFAGVTLEKGDTQQALLKVQKIRLGFSIWQSLWERKLIPAGLQITGTKITVQKTKANEMRIKGFVAANNNSQSDAPMNGQEFLAWLLTKNYIELRDVIIKYETPKGVYPIHINRLNLQNNSDQHFLTAQLHLQETTPLFLMTKVQWEGALAEPDKTNAKIYLFAENIAASQWSRYLTWKNWQLRTGIGSAKVWLTLKNGTLETIQIQPQLHHINLYSENNKTSFLIDRLSGDFGIRKTANDISFAGQDVLLDLPHRLWPTTNFYVVLKKNPDDKAKFNYLPKIIKIGYLNLADVNHLLLAAAPMPKNLFDTLNKLQPSGALQNIAIVFPENSQNWHDITGHVNLQNINIAAWKNIPGLNNFSAKVKWDGKTGEINFNSNQFTLKDQKIFANVVPVGNLIGDVSVNYFPQTKLWQLQTANLKINNEDLALDVAGKLEINQEAIVPDVEGSFSVMHAEKLAQYLPMSLFDKSLQEWLKTAFLSGTINAGKILIQGPLKDFPYNTSDGKFEIEAITNDVNLNYALDWPYLQHVNGKVIFSKNTIAIHATHAQLLGIIASNVTADIPNLSADSVILNVKAADIDTNSKDVMQLVHESSLKATLGKMFNGFTLNGAIKANVDLTMPLSTPDKTKVNGNMEMFNNEMNLKDWRLSINHLNGKVHFTESSTDAQAITGELFNKPLSLSLTTLQQGSDSIVRAVINNKISLTDLEQWLGTPLASFGEGTTDLHSEIDFSLQQPIAAHLQSNLTGLALQLPFDLGKMVNENKNFAADINVVNSNSLQVKLAYNKQFNAALLLDKDKQNFKLQAAALHLGEGEAALPPEAGLYLSAHFPKLDYETINKYLSQNKDVSKIDLPLRSIDVTSDSLMLGERSFTDVKLDVTPAKTKWFIRVKSQEANGKLELPIPFDNKGFLKANFTNLNLAKLAASTNQKNIFENIKVKDLPAIQLDIDNFTYGDIDFGHVFVKAVPNLDAMRIQNLSLHNRNYLVQASGLWTDAKTSLKGDVDVKNVTNLLRQFGMAAKDIILSNGTLGFDLGWQGAPFNPNLASLEGSAKVTMGKGRLADVGKSNGTAMDIGKMLSIFSLQTIPRRLSGDFSDVYQKGFSFDSVKGDFNFEAGNAYAHNVFIDGPMAKVSINGRIGLIDQDYDITLGVIPNVSSTLPITGVLFYASAVQPLIGLAALGVNSLLSPQLSKAVSFYYAVTGPWDNPSWKTISANQVEAQH